MQARASFGGLYRLHCDGMRPIQPIGCHGAALIRCAKTHHVMHDYGYGAGSAFSFWRSGGLWAPICWAGL
jgi:hypothetical protein